MKKTPLLQIIFAMAFVLSQQLLAQANSNASQQKMTGYVPVNGLKVEAFPWSVKTQLDS